MTHTMDETMSRNVNSRTANRNSLIKLTRMEWKLFLREPAAMLFGLAMPIVLLVILGSIPAFRKHDAKLGGLRVIDLYVPIVIGLGLATLCVMLLPGALASYREKGVLRRMSTTPVPPANLLLARVLIDFPLALVVMLLSVAVGVVVFGTKIPQQPVGFLIALILTTLATQSLGMVVAAVARTEGMGRGLGMILYYPMMFCAGVWLPRASMPHVLRRITDFTPLGSGVQALQDTIAGHWPSLLQIGVLVGFTLVAGAIAARLFRWE
jgi:ABC-2 type transport system permease protein